MKPIDTFLSGPPPQILHPFPSETGENNLIQLQFSVLRRRHCLEFIFTLEAQELSSLKTLLIPDLLEPAFRRRRDELWQHTCLEVFVGVANQTSYLEVNLSPSGDWNVYAFENYRTGMKTLEEARVNLSAFERSQDAKTLKWSASLSGEAGTTLNELFGVNGPHCPLVLGATAVLEYTTGVREYWALKHAGKKPDFHLRESFQLTL